MAKIDHEKRNEKDKVIERGGDRAEPELRGPGPAPAHVQRAEIARLKETFRKLPYAEQLAYLTTVQKRLQRLFRDEAMVSSVKEKQFKPLLKTPGRSPSAPAPRLRKDELVRDVLDVVGRRRNRLFQKQCVALLVGQATEPELRADHKFGKWKNFPKADVTRIVRAMVASGQVLAGRDGKLDVGRR